MNRYYTLWAIALVASLAGVSCQHEPGTEVPTGEQGPVFIAKLGQPTRSHFKDEDEGTEKAGTLYWDEDDKVGLTSVFIRDESDEDGDAFNPQLDAYIAELSESVRPDYKTAYQDGGFENAYLGAELEDFMVMSLADVNIKEDDPTMAILHPALTGSKWFTHADRAVGRSLYTFMGIYPVDEIQKWKVLCWQDDSYVIGVPMNVDHIQNGVDYGKYHICYDSGVSFLKPMMGLYIMDQVLSRETTVFITDMRPLTALLRFRMRVDGDPVNISKLVITLDDANRPQDCLSGKVYISAEGPKPYLFMDRWNSEETFNNVVIQFDEPVRVTNTPGNPYYAVVASSDETMTLEGRLTGWLSNRYSSSTIRFDAYDAEDNLLFTTTKTAPVHGFVQAGRYDLILSLDGSTNEEFEMTVNAGAYYDGGNPFVQE